MKDNLKNVGRKIGSRNKLTPKSKKILKEVLQDDLERMDKLINYIPFDKRFVALKPYAKLLTTGNDSISLEAKEIIFESLKLELKKLPFYLRQLSLEERGKQMRYFLQMLDKEQIEFLFEGGYRSH